MAVVLVINIVYWPAAHNSKLMLSIVVLGQITKLPKSVSELVDISHCME